MPQLTHKEIDVLPAGPELDTLVAEQVMGWRWHIRNDICYALWPQWSPSTDIAAAWEVIEKLKLNDWQVEISFNNKLPEGDPGTYYCGLMQGDDNAPWREDYGCIQTWAPTAPLAICRAALKAVL